MLIQIYAKYLVVVSFILALFSASAFSAEALTVSPVRAELSGNPGETIESEIVLFNEQKEDKELKTFYSSFANFEARGETGTPFFTSATEGLATWIKTSSQIVLKPGEKKTAPFSIVIPKNAEPGGHFAAIFWSTTPPQGDAGGGEQVSVSGRLGVLVLLTVNGEVKGGGGILEMATKNNQWIFSSFPVNFEYRFQNSSGNRVKLEGEIKIKNLFGNTLATLDANKGQGNVLPGSIRKFIVTWTGEESKDEVVPPQKIQKTGGEEGEIGFFGIAKKQWNNFSIGRYRADLNLKFGDKEEKASLNFWIIPWQLLIIILIVFVMGGFLLTKGIKKYNEWIISKAGMGRI